jgi:hypothetical protein
MIIYKKIYKRKNKGKKGCVKNKNWRIVRTGIISYLEGTAEENMVFGPIYKSMTSTSIIINQPTESCSCSAGSKTQQKNIVCGRQF